MNRGEYLNFSVIGSTGIGNDEYWGCDYEVMVSGALIIYECYRATPGSDALRIKKHYAYAPGKWDYVRPLGGNI